MDAGGKNAIETSMHTVYNVTRCGWAFVKNILTETLKRVKRFRPALLYVNSVSFGEHMFSDNNE